MKKPPPTTTRKPHKPAKPPAPPKQPGPGTLISVHSRPPPGYGGGKHGGTGKHQPPKKHRPPPKRKLSAGDVACCSAEALAASLRLVGQRVTDDDVLALYSYTASDPDEGATIAATLGAAQRHGLAGVRPAHIEVFPLKLTFGRLDVKSPVICGVTLPGGPHAITADSSGAAWSWGELWTLEQLQSGPAEEAWAVTWAT